jgi:hypothetical protein
LRDRLLWLGVLMSLALAGQVFALEYHESKPRRPVEGLVSFDLCRGYLIVWPEAQPDH